MSAEIGTNLVVQIDSNVVAVSRSCSFSLARNLIDVSNKGDGGWQAQEYGKGSSSVSVETLVDYTDTTGMGAVEDAIIAKTKLTLTYGKETTTTGDVTFSGSYLVSSYEQNADDDAEATASAQFESDGAITKTIAA